MLHIRLTLFAESTLNASAAGWREVVFETRNAATGKVVLGAGHAYVRKADAKEGAKL